MKEIRIHARAGQGAITTAAILGHAYFLKGKFPYAFPHFGAARMGAPMNAFVRVDDKPVGVRGQIRTPDYIVIVDATLMRGFNCLAGLKDDGIVIYNQREGEEIPKVSGKQKLYAMPGSDIAQKVIGRPLANTVLLGGFAAATGELDLEQINEGIKERFSGKIADLNIEAVKQGYEYVKKLIK